MCRKKRSKLLKMCIAQFHIYVKERVSDKTTDFNNTIKKNYLQFFNTSSSKTDDRSRSTVACLKTDVQLFSRMYTSCQSRVSDIDEFLMHQNQARPPSLASNSTVIHTTTESDLISCVESMVPSETNVPNVDAKIIEGAGVVYRLDPRKTHTVH